MKKTQGSTSTTQKSTKSSATSMAELMSRATDSFTPLKKGENVKGFVKKLSPQEILLDIGAKSDALVLEYDKRNMQQLQSLLKEGQEIETRVLSPESEEGYPVVSLRPYLQSKIFSSIEKSYKNHSSLPITIVSQTRSGYFVETEQGLRGFLPTSHVLSDEDIVGTKLEAQVIDFDRSNQRVVFSQKATAYVTDPEEIVKHVKPGDMVSGAISSISPYGLYVTIKIKKGVDIEGFVHISEISNSRVNVRDLYNVGDTIDAEVIAVDTDNRRVNLSIKKMLSEKFDQVRDTYKVEQKVKATVADVSSRGVLLTVEEGVQALIPAAKIPADTEYTVGQSVQIEVTDFDERRRLILASPVLTAIPLGYR